MNIPKIKHEARLSKTNSIQHPRSFYKKQSQQKKIEKKSNLEKEIKASEEYIERFLLVPEEKKGFFDHKNIQRGICTGMISLLLMGSLYLTGCSDKKKIDHNKEIKLSIEQTPENNYKNIEGFIESGELRDIIDLPIKYVLIKKEDKTYISTNEYGWQVKNVTDISSDYLKKGLDMKIKPDTIKKLYDKKIDLNLLKEIQNFSVNGGKKYFKNIPYYISETDIPLDYIKKLCLKMNKKSKFPLFLFKDIKEFYNAGLSSEEVIKKYNIISNIKIKNRFFGKEKLFFCNHRMAELIKSGITKEYIEGLVKETKLSSRLKTKEVPGLFLNLFINNYSLNDIKKIMDLSRKHEKNWIKQPNDYMKLWKINRYAYLGFTPEETMQQLKAFYGASDKLPNSDKPNALIVLPYEDHNNAFDINFFNKVEDTKNSTIEFFKNIIKKYDSLVIVADREQHVYKGMKQAKKIFKNIDLYISSGHGRQTGSRIGPWKDYGLLSVDDPEYQVELKNLKPKQIFCYSCLNGKGKDKEKNMVNFIDDSFKGTGHDAEVIGFTKKISSYSFEVVQYYPLKIKSTHMDKNGKIDKNIIYIK